MLLANPSLCRIFLKKMVTKLWPRGRFITTWMRPKPSMNRQYEDSYLELYDMKKDPNEWHNLATENEYSQRIKTLQSWIPEKWAPLSPYSRYDINPYFMKKTEEANQNQCNE